MLARDAFGEETLRVLEAIARGAIASDGGSSSCVVLASGSGCMGLPMYNAVVGTPVDSDSCVDIACASNPLVDIACVDIACQDIACQDIANAGTPDVAISCGGTPVMHFVGVLSAENESIAFGVDGSINACVPELLGMHGEFDCCMDGSAEAPGGVPHA